LSRLTSHGLPAPAHEDPGPDSAPWARSASLPVPSLAVAGAKPPDWPAAHRWCCGLFPSIVWLLGGWEGYRFEPRTALDRAYDRQQTPRRFARWGFSAFRKRARWTSTFRESPATHGLVAWEPIGSLDLITAAQVPRGGHWKDLSACRLPNPLSCPRIRFFWTRQPREAEIDSQGDSRTFRSRLRVRASGWQKARFRTFRHPKGITKGITRAKKSPRPRCGAVL
jgi:hypothetical protein